MSERGPSARPVHYSAAAIRSSFAHFVLGKGVSAVATLLVLFLLVREFSVPEFAAYTSLHALVLIIGLVSSFGVPQMLHRYLPELRTHHNSRAMYLLLVGSIVVRAMLYALLCIVPLMLMEVLSESLKLTDWQHIVPLYLAVGFFRVNSGFIAQALENLLWQRDAQYSLAAGGLLKLAGTLYMLAADQLTLANFAYVEIFSEGFSMLMLAMFILHRWSNDGERAEGDRGVLVADSRRYARFAFWCYLQNLTSIFYGSAPNRLFVAYFMSAEFIAVFGVVDRLIDFARRYEPLNMFVGLVRPVMMSRYSQHQNFDQLVRLANLVLLANFVLLFAPLSVLLVSGDELLNWATDAKFGNIALLVAGFYVVLLVTSVNNLLDLLVKAVEQNRVYMFSNLFLSGSLLLAVPLIPALGLWAIAIANLVGLAVSMSMVYIYLRRRGYCYRFEWRHCIGVIASSLAAAAAGMLSMWAGAHFVLATAITLVVYVGVVLLTLPVTEEEKSSMMEILPMRLRALISRGAVQ